MGYANVFNYQIFKFYMREITCTLLTLTVHEYTTQRLHAFYVRVGAATPLTRTVDQKLLGYRILAKWGLDTRLLQVMRC